MASPTTLPTFHPFSKLPSELRILIWQEAIVQEGPRIVDVKFCDCNHILGKCYVAGHGRHIDKDCCFHWENPLYQESPILCRCTESRLGPMLCGNHEGHTQNAEFHLCRKTNSKLSPLLKTCAESRYEVQRLGSLSFLPGDLFPGRKPANRDWEIPVWFNFGVDILAVSHDSWAFLYTMRGEASGTINGADKVTSLIITPPDPSNSEESLWSFKRLLDNFPSIENLYIAQHHSGGDGPLRLCELEQAVYGKEVKEYRALFDVLMEQINWFRKIKNLTTIKRFDLKCMQRTWEEDTPWTAQQFEWARKEGPGDFWQENGFWLEPASRKETLRFLRESELKDDLEMRTEELLALWEGWEKRLAEVNWFDSEFDSDANSDWET